MLLTLYKEFKMNIFEHISNKIKNILKILSKQKVRFILPENLEGITAEIATFKFDSDISTNVCNGSYQRLNKITTNEILAEQLYLDDSKKRMIS